MPILLKIGKVNGKLGPVWPWAKRKKKEVEEEENCKYFVDIAGLLLHGRVISLFSAKRAQPSIKYRINWGGGGGGVSQIHTSLSSLLR